MSVLNDLNRRFAGLPTAAKLLLILTAALLPIGLGLVWVANQGIREENQVLRERSVEHSRIAARAIESLIARNALALRVAANGRFERENGLCDRVRDALSITPAVARNFALSDPQGRRICAVGDIGSFDNLPLLGPGAIATGIVDDRNAVYVRVGLIGGMATGVVTADELRAASEDAASDIEAITLADSDRSLSIARLDPSRLRDEELTIIEIPVANGQITARVAELVPAITTAERLLLILPVLMWLLAALMSWVLVDRLLVRPLRRLQRSVGQFQPGDSKFTLPQKLGPATEILELRDAFARAVERVERSEEEMAAALGGQRRLVREVHHRVKNNLQVVASLLNIHGRSAETGEAREAYASISRRVSALAIVHRNHFAEMEENRGIAIRPLLAELAAELRAGAPEQARGLRIDLALDSASTTQDVAVAIAFLVTEIIEYAMLNRPEDAIEISLRRTSDITAELGLSSSVLVPDSEGDAGKAQFERIISGLAKQLRSDLDRKLGRYSVDLPVFPTE